MNNISKLRKIHDISQKDLATYLDISQSALSNWETNRYEPDFDSLIKLADYFNVSTDFLIGRKIRENIADPLSKEKEILELLSLLDDTDFDLFINLLKRFTYQNDNAINIPENDICASIACETNTTLDKETKEKLLDYVNYITSKNKDNE